MLDNAMKYYNKACEMSPDSILVRERKAGILLLKGDISGALVELALLRDLTPDRADVHILLGRLHAMNSNQGLALQSLTIAHSLDPLVS